MNEFIEYMQSFNLVTVTVRLILAMIIGGVIGLERGKQGRAAGMRTHILVCIGAALTAMIGFYLYDVESGSFIFDDRLNKDGITNIMSGTVQDAEKIQQDFEWGDRYYFVKSGL